MTECWTTILIGESNRNWFCAQSCKHTDMDQKVHTGVSNGREPNLIGAITEAGRIYCTTQLKRAVQ